jgi:hypothetical protein
MTKYRVAFNDETKVATILEMDGDLPEGSADVGEFNASAVSPNPTDSSIQHILTLLQRHGKDTTGVTVVRQPVTEVVDNSDAPPIEENMKAIADAVPEKNRDIGVDEDVTLLDGSSKGHTFTSSDDSIVKVSKSGKATGLKAGTATVDVKDAEGNTNQIVITVREATDGTIPALEGNTNGSDAKEAATA